MSAYPLVPLGAVLSQYKEYVNAPEARLYPKLSVKLYGRGVALDTPADGSTLKMQRHQLARAGQVILSEIWGKKGAIGLVPAEGEGALCTSHFFLFDVDRTKLDPAYLQLVFTANYLEHQLGANAQGTTGYAAVRPHNLLTARIPLPSRPEQRRIVARIEAVAAKVEEARRLRREAEDAVGALPLSAMVRILGGNCAGETLGDVLLDAPRNGWSPRCDNGSDGISVLGLGAVTGFMYRSSQVKRTSEPTLPGAHYWLRPGDLLITRSNTPALVGHAAIYSGEPAPCIYPDLMMRLPVSPQKADVRFVHFWLRSPAAREYIRRVAKGTSPTMAKISQRDVVAMPFPSGRPLDEQRGAVAYLDELQAKVGAMRGLQDETAVELEALLPAVLERAFRGEL